MTRHGRSWRMAAGAAALALLVTACGDDDEDDAAGAEDTTEEYCALAEELSTQDEFFTVEQLEQLHELAPEEIREEADLVVPVFTEAIEAGDPFAAFEDPVVDENIEAIEDFEAEVCGIDSGGGDGEEASDFEIAPEDEEYCAIATELDEQEDFPSPEQLETIRAAAPEEISDDINTVVEAFLANPDDPFAAFEDPEVEAAFEPIEAFEAEHCGLHGDDEGDDEESEQDPSVTEPDPSAAQVAVTATDYAFAFDPEPAAGRTQFTMTNEGEERHVMVLFKLADGATMDEVLASEGEEGIDGPELESDSAAPGETAVLTTDLEPGTYGVICYIPNDEGTPHLALGMTAELTVQ